MHFRAIRLIADDANYEDFMTLTAQQKSCSKLIDMEKILRESIKNYIDKLFIPQDLRINTCSDIIYASIEDAVSLKEDTFSQMLLKMIKERGMSEIECCEPPHLS